MHGHKKRRAKEVNWHTSSRLSDSQNILNDLNDNFAGRFSEAQPALQVLNEAVERTSSETLALVKLMEAARNDAKFGMQSLVKESEDLDLEYSKSSCPANFNA